MGKVDCTALKAYTGDGYRSVNSRLRNQPVKIGSDIEAKQIQAGLDKSFENAPTVPRNMVVYRGIDRDAIKGLKPGDSFIDKGFVSTTIKGTGEFKGGAKLEIRVPKGSKGIYVASISKYKSEREMLLNRGSKFKVIEQRPNGGLLLELIP